MCLGRHGATHTSPWLWHGTSATGARLWCLQVLALQPSVHQMALGVVQEELVQQVAERGMQAVMKGMNTLFQKAKADKATVVGAHASMSICAGMGMCVNSLLSPVLAMHAHLFTVYAIENRQPPTTPQAPHTPHMCRGRHVPSGTSQTHLRLDGFFHQHHQHHCHHLHHPYHKHCAQPHCCSSNGSHTCTPAGQTLPAHQE